MDYLAEQVGEAHLDENGTGGSIKITVEDVDGDLPPRPSSAAVLARVLESRAYLDLTGKVFVEPLAIKTKHGGAADVFEGRIIENGEKVAVKRLRLNIGGSEKVAKVCCT